jgi:hypothetical protein
MNKKNYRVEDIASFITDDPDIMNEFMLTDMPTSMPAAPTAPPPVAPPRTRPPVAPPKTTPKFDPLRPATRPGDKPAPARARARKGKGWGPKKRKIFEAYEQFPHQSMRDLHTPGHRSQNKIGFMQTPFIQEHGAELAKKAYEYSDKGVAGTHPETIGQPADIKRRKLQTLAFSAYSQMLSLERQHHRELEQIAIDAVAKMYNLSEENKKALLFAKLKKPEPIEFGDGEEEQTEEIDDHKSPEEMKRHINKRYMMNMLSQGAAIHNQWNGHLQEEIIDRINALNPQLAALYSSFGRTSTHHYWIHNLSMLLQQNIHDAQGLVQVTDKEFVPKDDEEEEEFDFGTPDTDDEAAIGEPEPPEETKHQVVYAQAVVFPILIQELVKGLVMLVSGHQFTSEEAQAYRNEVIEITDTLRDEVPQIHLGPLIWNVLLKSIPESHRSDVLTVLGHLAKSEFETFEKIFKSLGQMAKTMDLNDKEALAEIRNSEAAKLLVTLVAEELDVEPIDPFDSDYVDEEVDDEFDSGEPDEDEFGDDEYGDDVGGDDEDPYNNY